MVAEGAADLAGVCRMSIDDPDFPNKILNGREDEIRLPMRTGASLLQGNIHGKGWAGSAQNASFGREDQYRIHATAEPKKVVVVGGGSGGMEYAITAKQIGHRVVLFEKFHALGGVMDWAGNYQHLPNMELLRNQPNYHRKMMDRLCVETRLGIEATEALILAEKPDVVVIATGAEPVLPEVEGLAAGRERGFVLTIDEVMARCGARTTGKSVIIWGAGEGAELAFDLKRQGCDVRLLDPNHGYAPAMYIGSRATGISRLLAQVKIEIETGLTLKCVEEGQASFRNLDGASQTIAADSLVVCCGRVPRNALARALVGRGFIVQTVGDVRKPRSYANAIHEAAFLVRQI
jgi:NADPH-dependent 2,4-dienoyl-CoA reductase/sulfur reductase-like enzyme